MDEVRSVLAAVGSERAAFFGCHLGGRLALLLAATYPEQVSAVVTFGSHPATLRDADSPWASTPQQREQLLAAFRDGTLDPDGLLAMIAPGEATDAAMRRWGATFFYSAGSPGGAGEGI